MASPLALDTPMHRAAFPICSLEWGGYKMCPSWHKFPLGIPMPCHLEVGEGSQGAWALCGPLNPPLVGASGGSLPGGIKKAVRTGVVGTLQRRPDDPSFHRQGRRGPGEKASQPYKQPPFHSWGGRRCHMAKSLLIQPLTSMRKQPFHHTCPPCPKNRVGVGGKVAQFLLRLQLRLGRKLRRLGAPSYL